eukprot:TRINITY_DN507_c0_g1_i1.p1 TRINITY_DN507_c0_g1~~TRINITY_DN507_c0_g1_i1.p1  ORF type:complete len:1000 (-),score=293.97 TRINITY_DN507_c0_g1_i1:325-3324(-)
MQSKGSKYKSLEFVHVKTAEHWFHEINTNLTARDERILAVSSKWILVGWQSGKGGSLGVLSHSEGGKYAASWPVLAAHTSQINDMSFSPFNPNQFATAATEAKIYLIPEGGLRDGGQAQLQATLKHGKNVKSVAWNPVAQNVIATASEDGIKVWDISSALRSENGEQSGDEKVNIQVKDPLFMSWNYDGSLIAVSSKDRRVRVYDARSGTLKKEWEAHTGPDTVRLLWFGHTPNTSPQYKNMIATSGKAKSGERQITLWDGSTDSFEKLSEIVIGANAGALSSFLYDACAKLLYAYSKGDTAIRCYEILPEKPWVKSLNPNVTNKPTTPWTTMELIPKQLLAIGDCEMSRILKLTNKNIIPVCVKVPITGSDFREDLYPEIPSSNPALTSEQYFAGENASPQLESLKQYMSNVGISSASSKPSTAARPFGQVSTVNTPSTTIRSTFSTPNIIMPKSSSTPTSTGPSPVTPSKNTTTSTVASTPLLSSSASAMLSKPSATAPSTPAQVNLPSVRSLPNSPVLLPTDYDEDDDDDEYYIVEGKSIGRKLKFRHIYGEGMGQSTFYNDLKVANNAVMANVIKANKTHFAVGWEGVGGKVAVIPLGKTGRFSNKNTTFFETGSDVHDFDFNPFNDNMIAIGGSSGSVQIWTIPSSTGTNEKTPTAELRAHKTKVLTVGYHPTVADVLVSTGGDQVLHLWDVNTQQPKYTVNHLHEATFNLDFNPTGDLISVCNKDTIQIFDIRSQKSVHEGPSMGSARGSKVSWLGNRNQIFCIGFTQSTNERRFKLLDVRKLSEPLGSERLDYGNGILTPYFEEGMNVVTMWGKGDSTIKFMELIEEAPFVKFVSEYNSTKMQVGIAFMPRSVCDVKNVEFRRVLKLTGENSVEPHRLFVPRTRKEYFQDDVFPSSVTRAEVPTMSSAEFFSGQTLPPKLVDLNPGLPLLSTAPKIVRKMKKYNAEIQEESERTSRMNTLEGIYSKVMEFKESTTVPEHELKEGVDESEWDD